MGKILILANNDIGLYKFRKELIEELLKDNQVFISLPNGEYIKELVNMGCKFINTEVDRRGINPFTDLRLFAAYNRIIQKVKPDLVITYTIKPNIYGGLISRIRNTKYAVNITGLGTAFQKEGILKKIILAMYKVSLKKAKVVFFENEENRNIFVKNKLVSENKACELNGAGVNLEDYPFTPYPEESNDIRFLFIGRIMKEKGMDELLEAAEKIKSQYQNVYFDIIGPEEENYVKKLKVLQDNKVINYYGYQKDVKPFIKNAHCFVLPSYHEGMANTLLECGAMGRPLIASDIPGCREAVRDGVSGYLFECKNVNSLYKSIKTFIELPYEKKKNMGVAGRNLMEKYFDKNKIIKKTIDWLM